MSNFPHNKKMLFFLSNINSQLAYFEWFDHETRNRTRIYMQVRPEKTSNHQIQKLPRFRINTFFLKFACRCYHFISCYIICFFIRLYMKINKTIQNKMLLVRAGVMCMRCFVFFYLTFIYLIISNVVMWLNKQIQNPFVEARKINLHLPQLTVISPAAGRVLVEFMKCV